MATMVLINIFDVGYNYTLGKFDHDLTSRRHWNDG